MFAVIYEAISQNKKCQSILWRFQTMLLCLKMGPSRPLFIHFRLFNTVDSINFANDCIRTADLMESEATALPTEPQPLPLTVLLLHVKIGSIKSFIFVSPKGLLLLLGHHQCDQIGRFIGLWATF